MDVLYKPRDLVRSSRKCYCTISTIALKRYNDVRNNNSFLRNIFKKTITFDVKDFIEYGEECLSVPSYFW